MTLKRSRMLRQLTTKEFQYYLKVHVLTAVSVAHHHENLRQRYQDNLHSPLYAQFVVCRSLKAWSRENNLTLNNTKSVEILFTDKYRKCQFKPPPVVSGVDRVSSIKILGVTQYTNQQNFQSVTTFTLSLASLLFPLVQPGHSYLLADAWTLISSSSLIRRRWRLGLAAHFLDLLRLSLVLSNVSSNSYMNYVKH